MISTTALLADPSRVHRCAISGHRFAYSVTAAPQYGMSLCESIPLAGVAAFTGIV